MFDTTSGVVEDLLEDKYSYADEKCKDESGEASKEQRREERRVQKEIPEILNPEDFISKPVLSKKCTVPEDILVFQYPFVQARYTDGLYSNIQEHFVMLLDFILNKFVFFLFNRLH
jgi:hypothetical protein